MSELNMNTAEPAAKEPRTPYRLRVSNGTVHREEDGAEVKRTGYPKKVAEEIVRRIRRNQEVQLVAISDAACSNMVKALAYAEAYLNVYSLKYVIKGVRFEELPPRNEGQRAIVAKTILVGPEEKGE